jgi:hypothetical protein
LHLEERDEEFQVTSRSGRQTYLQRRLYSDPDEQSSLRSLSQSDQLCGRHNDGNCLGRSLCRCNSRCRLRDNRIRTKVYNIFCKAGQPVVPALSCSRIPSI